jgi:type I restriction enzyme S subunit
MNFKSTPFHEFVTLQRGFDLPSHSRVQGTYPVVAAGGRVGFHNEFKVHSPGVVVGRSGSIGNPQFIQEPFWPLNTTLFVKDFHFNVPQFVYYVLKTIDFAGFNAGGTVPTLNRNHLANIEVLVPEHDRQSAIAGFLGNLDALIDHNNRISSTLEQIAQTIFKSWFIDFDPVHAKARGEHPGGMDAETAALFPDSFEDSELGLIPSGWTVSELSSILTLQGGYSFKSTSWSETGTPVVKIGNVKPGMVDLAGCSFVSDTLAEELDSKYQLPQGSLIIGQTGYVGEVGLVAKTEKVPLLNQRVAKFGLRDRSWRIPFAYCITRESSFKSDVENASVGSAQANVGVSEILKIRRTLPPISLIHVFEDLFTPFFEQILTLRNQAESLEKIRDSLLPRLISGELEIPEEMRVD